MKYIGLEDLLKVKIHVPYNELTHYPKIKSNIVLMKPSAMLVNTLRGGVVEVLKKRKIIWQCRIGHL